jgi:hypothetical protein
MEFNRSTGEDRKAWNLAVGSTDLNEMAEDDRQIAQQVIIQLYRLGDLISVQHERGVLSEEQRETAMIRIRLNVCRRNFTIVWDGLGRIFSDSFQEWMAQRRAQCE